MVVFKKTDNNIYSKRSDSFKSITLGLLSPEQILERSYGEILNQTKPISSVRDINIQDLIHRKEMPINYNNIIKTVKNKTILITGGAGSIGSVILQLCLDSMAKKVICIDNSEYNTYLLTQNINSRRFVYKTADIKDKRKTFIFIISWKL